MPYVKSKQPCQGGHREGKNARIPSIANMIGQVSLGRKLSTTAGSLERDGHMHLYTGCKKMSTSTVLRIVRPTGGACVRSEAWSPKEKGKRRKQGRETTQQAGVLVLL